MEDAKYTIRRNDNGNFLSNFAYDRLEWIDGKVFRSARQWFVKERAFKVKSALNELYGPSGISFTVIRETNK